MAFPESKPVSAAGHRKQCNLSERDFVSCFGLGCAGRRLGSVGLGRARLGSLLAPTALSEFKPGLSFLLADVHGPGCQSKGPSFPQGRSRKGKSKGKSGAFARSDCSDCSADALGLGSADADCSGADSTTTAASCCRHAQWLERQCGLRC